VNNLGVSEHHGFFVCPAGTDPINGKRDKGKRKRDLSAGAIKPTRGYECCAYRRIAVLQRSVGWEVNAQRLSVSVKYSLSQVYCLMDCQLNALLL